MSDTLKYVKENMEESDFYGRLAWNTIKATIIMVAILFVGAVLLPFSTAAVPETFWLSLGVTYVVMLYIFRKMILPEREKGGWEFFKTLVIWFLGALIYTTAMYIGGEIIFIGLVMLGILVTVIFLFGDFSLTSVFTYLDLAKWVKKETEKEEKAKNGSLPASDHPA